MKTLVLRQPWASLVLAGLKTIELRSWLTNYRGDVLIVAGKGVDKADAKAWGWTPGGVDGPQGVTLCVVNLGNARKATAADSESACCTVDDSVDNAFEFSNVRPVERVERRGLLGLYESECPAFVDPVAVASGTGAAVASAG